MRNNPDNLSNQLICLIKNEINCEIKQHIKNLNKNDNEGDFSFNAGILNGRFEIAVQLKNIIVKWEKLNDCI
jgi:hypothetical protein